MSERITNAIETDEGTRKKKNKNKGNKKPTLLSPVEWLASLETSVGTKSKSPVNHIFLLITENHQLVLSEEEAARANQLLQRLSPEDQSRLNVSLSLYQRTQSNQHHPKHIGSFIQTLRPQVYGINEELLKDDYAERFYIWLETQYREQHPKSGLTELFVFSRNIMAELLAPYFINYADSASMQLIQFITKYYNASKEGKLPVQTGKRSISAPSEVIGPLYKMMKDALEVKSNPDLANYISALYRIFEVRVHKALEEKAEYIKKWEQQRNAHEELQSRYQQSQGELFDLKQQTLELNRRTSESEERIEHLKRELENETIRHEQKERMLEARLNTEKSGTVSKIKGKIEFELSEMEESLMNTTDEKVKEFAQYNIANIRKFLTKTE